MRVSLLRPYSRPSILPHFSPQRTQLRQRSGQPAKGDELRDASEAEDFSDTLAVDWQDADRNSYGFARRSDAVAYHDGPRHAPKKHDAEAPASMNESRVKRRRHRSWDDKTPRQKRRAQRAAQEADRCSRSVALERLRTIEVTKPKAKSVSLGAPHASLHSASPSISSHQQAAKAVIKPRQSSEAVEEQQPDERDKWGKSIKIWSDLLQNEAKLKGNTGIEQVWVLFKEAEVHLPVRGRSATAFWGCLTSNSDLHEDVFAYAVRQKLHDGQTYKPLYRLFVCNYLRRGDHVQAAEWHQRIFDVYMEPENVDADTLQIIAPVVASTAKVSLGAFKYIYEQLRPICLPCYDHLIPPMLEAGRVPEAMAWHQFLASHKDYPSREVAESQRVLLLKKAMTRLHTFNASDPLWTATARDLGSEIGMLNLRENKGPILEHIADFTGLAPLEEVSTPAYEPLETGKRQDSAQQSKAPNATKGKKVEASPKESKARRRQNDGFSIATAAKGQAISPPAQQPAASQRGLISSLIAEIKHANSDGFSDEFCARLYATRALTPSWVSSFIQGFSGRQIGPLAFRELALRAETTEDLEHYINDLRKKSIDTGRTKFVRIVKELARKGDTVLLHHFLSRDDHPANIGIGSIQRNILDQAVKSKDAAAVHQQLTLMSMLESDPKTAYMNALLVSYIRIGWVSNVLQYADRMQAERIHLTSRTVEVACRRLLLPRSAGHHPSHWKQSDLPIELRHNDLRIVTNMMLRVLESGGEVPDKVWMEVFKRHGLKGLQAAERLSHATLNALQTGERRIAQGAGASRKGAWRVQLSSQNDTNSVSRESRTANLKRMLFTQQRLQSIVSWGFFEGLRRLVIKRDSHLRMQYWQKVLPSGWSRWPSKLTPPPVTLTFFCGVDAVQNLAKRGVHVQNHAVEQVIRDRLWILYGPGRTGKRRNVTARRISPYSIVEMLQASIAMWEGPPLFQDVRRLLDDDRSSPSTVVLDSEKTVASMNIASANIEWDHAIASHEPQNHDKLNRVSMRSLPQNIAVTLFRNSVEDHSPQEAQIRGHTEALMRVFWTAKTIGSGGHRQMRAKRRALSEEEWTRLLHSWARYHAEQEVNKTRFRQPSAATSFPASRHEDV